MISVRPALEPTCTTPWMGIMVVTGMTEPMIASRVTPPPRPSAAEMNEVNALAPINIPAIQSARPSGCSHANSSI